MRVGIDASNLRTGGGVTHLLSMLEATDPGTDGVAGVTVWGGSDTLRRLPARPWLTLVHDPALDRPLPYRLVWQRTTLARLAAGACDLLFAPGGSYGGGFRPFATMSRNLLPFQEEERRRYGASWMFVKLGLLRRGQCATFRRADGVIFLNEYARDCVLATTGPLAGATAVVPHGVDEIFRMPPRPVRPLGSCTPGDPLRLLYVSNVEVYKHQWHVVDAVARLRARGLPLILDLVGASRADAGRRLAAAIAEHDRRGEFVRVHGAVSHDELPAYYRRADLFVFASSCENMPNILLEAMAAGLPIACADRGPMPAMLGDAGVYFDPTTPPSIAEAVAELAAATDRRARLADEAFRRAGEYHWRRCATDTWRFLGAVHSRGGRGPAER
jgi:glycosyltransferase involved in cell wall biosynthesis